MTMENETINEAAEEMKWEAKCDINELPERLRRLAIYRKETVRPCPCDEAQGTVGSFTWVETPEDYSFWQQVYYGDVPANLEEVLDQFEREHPELLDETEEVKEEVISEKETTTETAEEKLDQENKVDNPRTCIFYRCDPSEIYSVTEKLMEMGFWTGPLSNLNDNNTVFEVICEHIGVFSRCYSHTKGQFPEIECKTKDEFLQKVEESIPRVFTTGRKDATEEVNQESDISEKVEEAREDAAHTVAYTLDPWLESVARDNEEKIRRLVELGVLDTPENTAVRDHNIGASDYAKHIFQPWVAWQEYNLDPWDADIVKRVLRNKAGESRILDYEKIKHICDEKIRQLKIK